MGAGLSSIIKSIDGADDSEKQTRDALNALFALGESRNDAAFAKATSDAMKIYAPIKKLLLQRQSIIANASTGTDAIVGGIKQAVGSLMKGQVLDGVVDLIQSALNVVLGASSGQISQSYTYALIATDLGALLRIDVDVYSFEVYSKGLQDHAKTMTAITSLVSTVDPRDLTLGDLRGIISLSFGSSDLERQQSILKAVQDAWVNDKKIAEGQPLTEEDQKRFASLLEPSEYEAQWLANKAHNAAPNGLEPPPTNIDRAALRAALADFKRASPTVNGGAASPSSTSGTGASGALLEVFLWASLTNPATDEWLHHMEGALSGFNEPDMFLYVGVSGGRSGNAVSFKCNVNAEPKLFDLAIEYINKKVIPSLRKADYLSDYISQTALQFSHPSKGGTGLPTVVKYRENDVVNHSREIISFHSVDDTVLLTLQPNATGALDGSVAYVTADLAAGTSAAPASAAEGAAPAPAAPAPAPAAPSNTPSPVQQFVTYEDVQEEHITKGVKMQLYKLSGTGYSIDFFYDGDKPYAINYSSLWTGEQDVGNARS